MKKPHLLTIVFLLFTFSLTAQSIERQLIGVAVGNNTDDQILLDWTLGEPFTAFDNVPFGFYKEGFLQPNILSQKLNESEQINNEISDRVSAEVFPNPFIEAFTFQVNQAQLLDAQLTILDYSGKILMKKILPAGSLKMEWTINDYPTGLYFLQFADNSGTLKHSFKLLKL